MIELNKELANILKEHDKEIECIGNMFGDMEKRVLLATRMDLLHMFEGYLYHVAKMVVLWGSSAQEKITFEECDGDHEIAMEDERFARIEVMRRKLFKFTHKLNNPEQEFPDGMVHVITDGKWSHRNYDVSKCFRADYDLEIISYGG